MLEVIFAEGARGRDGDRAPVDRRRRPARARRGAHARGDRARAAGVPADEVRELARDLAAAERAAVYGRTGSCLGRNGTLVAFLLDALNARHRQPRPRRAARCSATRRSTSAGSPSAIGAGSYGKRPLAGRRPARGARLAAGLGDGEGDDDARAGADPGDVRLRRQPGALGARTATSSRRRSRGSSCGRDRPLRHRDRPLLPTTCSRRRRSTSARTSRCRSWRCSATPFIQMTEAVVEPRGEARQEWEIIEEISRADRGRPLERLARRGCSARPGSEALAAAAGRPAAARSARRATCSDCAAAGSASTKLARTPHGIVLAEHLAPGVLARARSATTTAGSTSTRPRSPPRSAGSAWRAQRRRPATSRCG